MDCLCLKGRRERRRKEKAIDGIKNLAYNNNDGDQDSVRDDTVNKEPDNSKTDQPLSAANESVNDLSTTQAQVHTSQADRVDGKQVELQSQDDSYLPEPVDHAEVDLVGTGAVGIGVTLSGTATQGIIVSELDPKGPAYKSGKVEVGDRILGLTISFDNSMVYEDALTIISYASPYPITLKLAKSTDTDSNELFKEPSQSRNKVYHPVYRSQSVGGAGAKKRKQKKLPPRPGTSLSQVEFVTHGDSKVSSEESLDGALVKGKFGVGLDLMDDIDSSIQKIKERNDIFLTEKIDKNDESSSSSTNSINVEIPRADKSESLQPPEKPKRTYAPSLESSNKELPSSVEECIVPSKIEKVKSALSQVEGENISNERSYEVIELDSTLMSENDAVLTDSDSEIQTPIDEPLIEKSVKTEVDRTPNMFTENTSSHTADELHEDKADSTADNTAVDNTIGLSQATNDDDTFKPGSQDVHVPNEITVDYKTETEIQQDNTNDIKEDERQESPVDRMLESEEDNAAVTNVDKTSVDEDSTIKEVDSPESSTKEEAKSSESEIVTSPNLFKATSRKQLEAARARFFAELMQSSDIFKDTPLKTFGTASSPDTGRNNGISLNNNEMKDNNVNQANESET